MYLELELMESICSGMQRGGTNGVTIPGIQGRDNLLHQMFLWMVYVYNFWPSEIPWHVDKCSLKDDGDIQRQEKLLYCAANKLRHFDQCSPAVKSLYLVPIASHANAC